MRTKKKKYETSSSSDDSSDSDYICESPLLVEDSSDSDYEPAPVKKRLAVAKNASLPAKKTKQASNSDSSDSSSDEELSSDEVNIAREAPARNKNPAVATKATVPAAKTVKTDSSSDSSDNDVSIETITRYNARLTRYDNDFDEGSSSDEDKEKSKPSSKKGPTPVTEKESSDSSSDEHRTPQKVTLPICAAKNVPSESATAQTASSGSSSEEESDEEDVKKAIACFHSSRQAGQNRAVRLDFTRERGEYTTYSGNGNNSFQGGKGPS